MCLKSILLRTPAVQNEALEKVASGSGPQEEMYSGGVAPPLVSVDKIQEYSRVEQPIATKL